MAKPIYVSRNKLFSPRLRGYYITLGDAKYFNSKDDLGGYSVSLTANPEEVSEWINQMEVMAEELYTEWIDESTHNKVQRREPLIPVREETDREGNETGNILIKFSAKAHRKAGEDDRIPTPTKVLDCQGKALSLEQKRALGRGTLMSISYDAKAYYMSGVFGVSFGLRAVQVIEPVWREADAATDFDNRTTEGYTIDEEAVEASDFS